jgi:hypothetical protein
LGFVPGRPYSAVPFPSNSELWRKFPLMRRNNADKVKVATRARHFVRMPYKDYIPCMATSCCLGRWLQLLVGGARHMTVS